MRSMSPVLTATRALFLLMPVAKALGSGELKIPTSGMPMPASRAWRRTVSSNHCSVLLRGCSMTWTRMVFLAIHLEMAREMNEPPKPNTAAKISRAFRFRLVPDSSRIRSTPRRRSTMLSTTMIARLVARNRKIRFIVAPMCSKVQDQKSAVLDRGNGKKFNRSACDMGRSGDPAANDPKGDVDASLITQRAQRRRERKNS